MFSGDELWKEDKHKPSSEKQTSREGRCSGQVVLSLVNPSLAAALLTMREDGGEAQRRAQEGKPTLDSTEVEDLQVRRTQHWHFQE